MNDSTKALGSWIVAAAVAWHVLSVLTPAWVISAGETRGRDFASYYYAVQVAADGGDPYDKKALNQAARQDSTRRGVHPYLYAPPFLLVMAWALPTDLSQAFHIWFWLHELAAIATALVLWAWWRRLGAEMGWLVAVMVALMTAIPNNHAMGQANFPGLALALAGLWQTEERRPVLGGALMGAACMLKMSPALFVVWWLVKRQWHAVGAAVATAVVLSVVSLPLAPVDVQWRFYTQILPTFGSGSYNGLAVPIGLFGNHSLPNLLNDWFPGDGKVLSDTARTLSSLIALGSLGALAWLFRAPEATPLQRAAQASCVGVLILLVPVYTYEHHLVFAIPAAVLAVFACVRGHLPVGWTGVVAFSVVVLLFDLQSLKGMALAMPASLGAVASLFRELKFLALLGLLVSTAVVGARSVRERG
ncbi:MAG: DUF2029 domain-containing protein [Myxococcales bacterium]|nr:DUF2029 domain-containing protein [Myxococcales bacterium]